MAAWSKTDRHAPLSSEILWQLATAVGSGMWLLQSRKASGAHAACCPGVPRFSCATRLVTQEEESTAITKRLSGKKLNLYESFMI